MILKMSCYRYRGAGDFIPCETWRGRGGAAAINSRDAKNARIIDILPVLTPHSSLLFKSWGTQDSSVTFSGNNYNKYESAHFTRFVLTKS